MGHKYFRIQVSTLSQSSQRYSVLFARFHCVFIHFGCISLCTPSLADVLDWWIKSTLSGPRSSRQIPRHLPWRWHIVLRNWKQWVSFPDDRQEWPLMMPSSSHHVKDDCRPGMIFAIHLASPSNPSTLDQNAGNARSPVSFLNWAQCESLPTSRGRPATR